MAEAGSGLALIPGKLMSAVGYVSTNDLTGIISLPFHFQSSWCFFYRMRRKGEKKSSFILPGHSSAIGFVGADFLSPTWWRSLAHYRASLSKKPIHCATKRKKKKAKFQTQFFIFHLKPSLFKHVSIHMDIFKIQ